jgi:hypothetical protein
VVFARKGGGVEMELTDENRKQFGMAFQQMLVLTDQVRDTLIRRQISKTFSQMEQ